MTQPPDMHDTPDASDPPPKFRRRAEARPDEVLDAALSLFLTEGYARTTVDRIARKAGLSKGAVYLYFPSKEAILEGLVRRAVAPIADTSFAGMDGYRGDPRPPIRAFLTAVAQVLGQEPGKGIPIVILREAPAAPAIARLFRDAVLDVALPALTGLLRQGVEGGHIRPVDPELTARTVVGPLLMHLLLSEVFGIRPEDGLAMDRLVENHMTILFAGLEPERTGP